MIRRAFLLLAATAPAALPQDQGFTGKPLVRIDSDGGVESKRTELSEETGAKYPLRITKKGRRFIWASRNDRELMQSFAGDWIYYISPEGSGYVKVYKGGAELPYDYLEHVTNELTTVTYWGKRSG